MSDSKKRDYAVLDNFGVKYQINKQHTLGVFGGVIYDRPKAETLLEDGAGQTLLTQGYDQRILNLNGGVSYAARLAVCEGLSIASTVSYSHSQSDGSAYYSTNEGELAESKSRTHYLTFHPRATLVFAGGNQLTGGLSYSYALDDNDADGVKFEKCKVSNIEFFKYDGTKNSDYAPTNPLYGSSRKGTPTIED